MPNSADRQDPYVAFRFEIRFDDLPVGGFSECGGLQLETEVQDYAEGGFNQHVHKFPGRTKQTNITLKRGIVDRELHDWYLNLVKGTVSLKNGSILVRDMSGKKVDIEWQFQRAFPCKWIGPDLNATQNNVAVETIEICHQGLIRRT